ncbi:fimbrial protein [Serratia sp. PAMC26656]|uniref:fimbrial protein n=1 Tax=Serratia sp. PAMC26656 TaxID=2775909 RepID=UPI001F157516|nr:fimbrial protein [Serratia sp. PAMC26656]
MIKLIYNPHMLLSLFLFLFIGDAKAFTCRTSDGGIIPPGGSTTPVDVRVNIGPLLNEGVNEIVNVGQISCSSEATWMDVLYTDYGAISLNPIGKNTEYGMYINGVRYMAPVPRLINVLTVSDHEKKALDIRVFIKLKSSPAADIIIRKGDIIGYMNFIQNNSLSGCPQCGPYRWRLIANNDAYFATTSCTINGAKQVNVEFGLMSTDKFTQSVSNAQVKKEQSIIYQCDDTKATQDILVRLIGDTSSFSLDLIRSSNENLGVAMMYNNEVVRPGKTFRTRIVNGVGNDTVTFIPVKKMCLLKILQQDLFLPRQR